MNLEVVTIGLGYIGLPTSALIASCGTNVLGVDISQRVVDTINQGNIHIVEPDLANIVSETVQNGKFKASTKPLAADVYLIVVPTPFKQGNEPDISFIESATMGIIPLLKKGDLYIIESTSPVGTTEKMRDMIYSERPDLQNEVYIAYCPERVLPGKIMFELVENDRVIGGINKISTEKAISFYRKYVKGKLYGTTSRTAEMCKLVENSSRDVQIAFANELSLICDKSKINVWELIELANKHPRVNILQPGCGVGGHCIAVDPYFIISDFPNISNIIGAAREINNYKSDWCIEKIISSQLKFEIENGRKPVTAFMGLSFKANVDDLRQSPAKYISSKFLNQSNENINFFVEPNINEHEQFKLTNYIQATKKADIIVFLVAHREFYDIKIEDNKLVIDFCGLTKNHPK